MFVKIVNINGTSVKYAKAGVGTEKSEYNEQSTNQRSRRRRGMPFDKYKAFRAIDLPDRQWPSRVLTQAPRWCSVDLRDGNQALIDPMSVDERCGYGICLSKLGFASE